jgi:hypothetical protein
MFEFNGKHIPENLAELADARHAALLLRDMETASRPTLSTTRTFSLRLTSTSPPRPRSPLCDRRENSIVLAWIY